jgi:hypothetical protein
MIDRRLTLAALVVVVMLIAFGLGTSWPLLGELLANEDHTCFTKKEEAAYGMSAHRPLGSDESEWVDLVLNQSFAYGVRKNYVIVTEGKGLGSNTKIRRFKNKEILGDAISYSDNVDGAIFSIKEDGVYSMTYVDTSNDNKQFGITLNTPQNELNVRINDLSSRKRLVMETTDNTYNSVSVTMVLRKNDVIRPHTSGDMDNYNLRVRFSIVKVNDIRN